MSRLDPYSLHALIQSFLHGQQYGPQRIEPTMGRPTTGVDPGPQLGPRTGEADPNSPVVGTPPPPDTPDAKRARTHGVQAVRDEIGRGEPDASTEPKISQSGLGPGIDEAVKQAWVENMRRLREAARNKIPPPPPPDPAEIRARMGTQEWHPSGVSNPPPPPEPPMPMTPPPAFRDPSITPSNTIPGFFGENAVRHALFGTSKNTPDPQE